MDPALLLLADAITAELNNPIVDDPENPPFVLTVQAVRRYIPIHDLKQLATLSVSVIPAGWVTQRLTRGSVERQCVIHLGVQKKLESETNAEIDPLVKLTADLERYFDAHIRPRDYSAAYYAGSEATTVPIDDDDLYQKRLFTAVLALKFNVPEGL